LPIKTGAPQPMSIASSKARTATSRCKSLAYTKLCSTSGLQKRSAWKCRARHGALRRDRINGCFPAKIGDRGTVDDGRCESFATPRHALDGSTPSGSDAERLMPICWPSSKILLSLALAFGANSTGSRLSRFALGRDDIRNLNSAPYMIPLGERS
jgi:hypothetical protein